MTTMTRRTAIAAALSAAALARTGWPGVFAQAATPTASALDGYPELTVTITDSAYQLSTNSVPAGLVRLIVKNTAKNPTSAAVVGPGAGQSAADFQNGMATPAPNDGPPAFLYSATILGGPQDVAPGGTSEVLINVAAGDWFVFGDGQGQPPVPLKAVTGGGKTAEPTATLELLLGDFSFNGLDAVKAGSGLWKITNKGAQPHMVSLAQVPTGTTEAQILASFEGEMSGTPAAGGISHDQVIDVASGVLALSSMQSLWLPVDFKPGTYFAACYFSDPATGKLHAMEGMIKVFTIA